MEQLHLRFFTIDSSYHLATCFSSCGKLGYNPGFERLT